MSNGIALHEAIVVEVDSQLFVALVDESQQPWEHSHTPHTYCLQRLHSAWHAVTPPVTIVLPLDAKFWDLAMHMRAVAAVEYLGSQLMPQNVESVYDNDYFRSRWPKKACELAYPQSAANPVCLVCACDAYVCGSHLEVQ